MAQAVSKYELADILAVREHWAGMTIKELARNTLLTEEEVKDIMDDYNLRSHEFTNTDFKLRLFKEFGKNDFVKKSIRECFDGALVYENSVISKLKRYERKIKGPSDYGNCNKVLVGYLVENGLMLGVLVQRAGVDRGYFYRFLKPAHDSEVNIHNLKVLLDISDKDFERILKNFESWSYEELYGLFSGFRFGGRNFVKDIFERFAENKGYKSFIEYTSKNKFSSKEKEYFGIIRNAGRLISPSNITSIMETARISRDEMIELITWYYENNKGKVKEFEFEVTKKYLMEVYHDKDKRFKHS